MKQIPSGSRTYLRAGPMPTMPPGLEELMEGLARDVLKNNPTDIYRFCSTHMEKLVQVRDAYFKSPPFLTLEEKIKIAQRKVKQRATQRQQKFDKELKEAIRENNKNTSVLTHQSTLSVLYAEEINENSDVKNDIEANEPLNSIEHSSEDKEISKKNLDILSNNLKNNLTLHNIEHGKTNEFNDNKIIDKSDVDITNKTEISQLEDTLKNISEFEKTAENVLFVANTEAQPLQEIDDNSKHFDQSVVKVVDDVNKTTDHTEISVLNNNEITSINQSNEKLNFENGNISSNNEDVLEKQYVKRVNEVESLYTLANAMVEQAPHDNISNTNGELQLIKENVKSMGLNTKHNNNNSIEDSTTDLIRDQQNEIMNVEVLEDVGNHVSQERVEEKPQGEKSLSVTDSSNHVNLNEEDIDIKLAGVNEISIDNFNIPSNNSDIYVADTPMIFVNDSNTEQLSNLKNKLILEQVEEQPNNQISINNIEYEVQLNANIGTKDDINELIPLPLVVPEIECKSTALDLNVQDKNSERESIIIDNESNSLDSTVISNILTNANLINEFKEIVDKSPNITKKPEEITRSIENENLYVVNNKDNSLEDNAVDGSNSSFIDHDENKDSSDESASNTLKKDIPMDLETAAITIQKVFRTFMFKSRTSTLDDTPNYESSVDIPCIPSDDSNTEDERKTTEDNTKINTNSERRPPGLTRMDSVLQTVNEEKSLSLSTDDSSTISSAATTIQAHVRGYLVRKKLNSYKTSSSSLVNSEGQSLTSMDVENDVQKGKTVLNIHIVPEGAEFNLESKDEGTDASIDLPLDNDPPIFNLHPLGYDKSERRKQLKREDAIQSVSPPSNNSGKLSEDSVKDITSQNNETVSKHDETFENSVHNDIINNKEAEVSRESTPTKSITADTVIEQLNQTQEISSGLEINSDIENRRKRLTKMGSDEMDVVTPNEFNSLSLSETSTKLLHSGEFHDVVLPTRVTRSDSTVVREFKNVLAYFLIWNN